jgi:hypothetical protein
MGAIDRIKEEIRDRGWTAIDFCQKYGITAHHWRNWTQRGLPDSQILKVADYLRLRSEWITKGSGPRYLAGSKPVNSSKTAKCSSLDMGGVLWAFQFMEDHISEGLIAARGLVWKAKIFKLLYETYVEGHGKIAHASYKVVLRSIGL